MIGSLRGTVLEHSPAGEAILEVGGVGYRVLVPAGTPGLVPGEPAFLFTHLHVREDARILYGFSTRRNARDTFESLLGATGVGPSSRWRSSRCTGPRRCASSSSTATPTPSRWCPASGSGPRSASSSSSRRASRSTPACRTAWGRPARGQVREALAGLGYGPDEVRDALTGLEGDESAEQLLRDALRRLAGARV